MLLCVSSLETYVVPTRRCSSVIPAFWSFSISYVATLPYISLTSCFFLFAYSNMIFSTVNFNHLFLLILFSPIFHIPFPYILYFTFFTHCLYYVLTPYLTTEYSILSNFMFATRLTHTFFTDCIQFF